MFKFFLILSVCSSLDGSCFYPLKSDNLYDTHYDCAVAGYQHSQTILRTFGKARVNQARLLVSFRCEPVKEKNV